jgi:dienelactone hydrolase
MIAALALLLLLAPPADAKKSLDAVAKLFLDHAEWAKGAGQREEARFALLEARAAGAEVTTLLEEVEAMEEGAAPAPDLEIRRRKVRAEAARLYDKLGGAHALAAARLEPTKARLSRLLALAKQSAGNQAKLDETGAILVALRELDPDGPSAALELELAQKDLAPVRGRGHPMVGYVALPEGWKRTARYPVLVAVEGAGCGFAGAARDFARSRGARKFIVLVPCSLSNTNDLAPAKYPYYGREILDAWNARRIEFDLAGLDALLEVVRGRFGGEEPIGITGFSGGGNLCYAFTVRNPSRVRFCAPACPNFGGMGFAGAQPVEGGGPPVRIFTGEKDEHRFLTHGKTPPGIEQQTDAAVEALARLGFTNVRRTMLPGVGHARCAGQVWAVADEFGGR